MKISQEIGVPVELGRLQSILNEFDRVAGAAAEITFHRVGRGASPLELTCEWDSNTEVEEREKSEEE